MSFNAPEAARRLSGNPDFINIMRLVCKVSGWNVTIPDRVQTKETVVVKGVVQKEIIRHELASADTHIKYNAKREVWAQVRKFLDLSDETMAAIEYGMKNGDELTIKGE